MVGVAGELVPLAERLVADAGQGELAGGPQQALMWPEAGAWGNGGVPNWPAEAGLDSLVTAVHCEHERSFAAPVDTCESRVGRLEGEAAVME